MCYPLQLLGSCFSLRSHVFGHDVEAIWIFLLFCFILSYSFRSLHSLDRRLLAQQEKEPGIVAARLRDRERLAGRSHPFATPALLQSQLETLEEPREALRIDGTKPVPEIVTAIRTALAM